MQYLGVEYSVKHMPELDPDFIPFGVWLEAYACRNIPRRNTA